MKNTTHGTLSNFQCETLGKTGCVLAMTLLKRHPIILVFKQNQRENAHCFS